jgi:glycosyltransferase A (GT-A) superfamily protein (DUF2064 family)
MRLLLVFIREALPGQVLPGLSASSGPDEALRIHNALVSVLLRQLSGLHNTRLRFVYAPEDAGEALRFALLPQFGAARFEHRNDCYVMPAAAGRPELAIEFRPQGPGHHGQRLARAVAAGFTEGFQKVAAIGADCPGAGSRWVHAAFARLGPNADLVVGPTTRGGCHLLALQQPAPELLAEIPHRDGPCATDLLARAAAAGLRAVSLPALTAVRDAGSWDETRAGPFGPALDNLLAPGKRASGEVFD